MLYRQSISGKYFGMSIARYIRKKRVAYAKEYLKDGKSVADTAKMVGIYDYNYFSKYLYSVNFAHKSQV